MNQLLIDVFYAAFGSKASSLAYLKAKDWESSEKAADMLDTSPEVISNLVRLEKENLDIEAWKYSFRKINVKLVVLG